MLIVCTGSRTWTNVVEIYDTLSEFYRQKPRILVGDAPGADRVVRAEAYELGFSVEVFSADWGSLGKGAGPARNRQMLDRQPDLCIAFWDGNSRGTLDCLSEAVRRGIPTRIVPSRAVINA